MEEYVGDVKMVTFEIEEILEDQSSADALLFCGMDKTNAAVCTTFDKFQKCDRGNWCPFRHILNDRSVVCKHWLRGLCKKGDDCEFLHEYNMSKMPECYFFAKFGECGNKECHFLHIDPDKKLKDCLWYNRGFCRHGPSCKNRHARRLICQNYSIGFCHLGPECKYQHPIFDLPVNPDGSKHVDLSAMLEALNSGANLSADVEAALQLQLATGDQPPLPEDQLVPQQTSVVNMLRTKSKPLATRQQQQQRPFIENTSSTHQYNSHGKTVTCFNCYQVGHVVGDCPTRSQSSKSSASSIIRREHDADLGIGLFRINANKPRANTSTQNDKGPRRPLIEVTCYKCNEKGHYANKCPKGMLAFLSNNKNSDVYQPHPQQKPHQQHLLPQQYSQQV